VAPQTLAEGDRPAVEKRMEAAVKEAQRFERVVVSRAEALTMFTENKFKARRGLVVAVGA
jgi:threonyl-tRNA synthetase